MTPHPPAALSACLRQHGIAAAHIAALENFTPRDGFCFHHDDADWQAVKDYFDQCWSPLAVAPILQDEESNLWFVFLDPPLRGMVGHFQHDEPILVPSFAAITALLAAIAAHPEAHDGYGLLHEAQAAQFPALNTPPMNASARRAGIDALRQAAEASGDEEARQRLHLIWFNLLSPDEAAALLPYLDDEDMYVQERAVELIGCYGYRSARAKLQELQHTALPNGRTAAKRVLARWRQNEVPNP